MKLLWIITLRLLHSYFMIIIQLFYYGVYTGSALMWKMRYCQQHCFAGCNKAGECPSFTFQGAWWLLILLRVTIDMNRRRILSPKMYIDVPLTIFDWLITMQCAIMRSIVNWAHLCRHWLSSKKRMVDLNLTCAAVRLKNVIYSSLLSSLVNLENDIYVTISTPKSHRERKTAKENFSTNYRPRDSLVKYMRADNAFSHECTS